jgi:predicted porin
MRKLLLAGVALAGVAAYLPTTAQAQSPVFNETSRPGKLDGAAPGSVQVNLGGTLFTAILFTSGTNDSGSNKVSNPNLLNYFRLYPNFDYANPSGIHFGVSAEVRSNGAPQAGNRTHNTLYWHSATAYISSPMLGKFAFGTPNSAVDGLGVGTGDDFGTGGFYSEYGWPNAPIFLASDAYDGDVPKQKLAYTSPSFAGFVVGVSYQPTSVGLNNSSGLTDNTSAYTSAGQSKDRIEIAAQFSHAFGAASVKADVGYATASVAPGATAPALSGSSGYKSVSFINAGAVVNVAGFEIEGQINTGNFAANYNDSGSPFGPELKGAKKTTAYIVGVGYSAGPYSIGAQYYGVNYDAWDAGGSLGSTATISGEALGAGYQVGPGVNVYFDAMTNENKVGGNKVHGTGIGLGTYFSW